ncbi:hypothetical protein BJX70DRAFT_359995 [Aspergillus crustosus]
MSLSCLCLCLKNGTGVRSVTQVRKQQMLLLRFFWQNSTSMLLNTAGIAPNLFNAEIDIAVPGEQLKTTFDLLDDLVCAPSRSPRVRWPLKFSSQRICTC